MFKSCSIFNSKILSLSKEPLKLKLIGSTNSKLGKTSITLKFLQVTLLLFLIKSLKPSQVKPAAAKLATSAWVNVLGSLTFPVIPTKQ